jgi:hypothetical protein
MFPRRWSVKRARFGWAIFTHAGRPTDTGIVTVIVCVREWPDEEMRKRLQDQADLLMHEFWSQMIPRKRSD